MARQRGGVLIRLWGQSRDGTGGANFLSTVGPCCFLPLPLESTVLCFSVMAQPLMWGGVLPVCAWMWLYASFLGRERLRLPSP